LSRHRRTTDSDPRVDMVGSQMGWNDTPFAIEHKTIVRTVAHYYAPRRRGEMRRKDKPPRIGVGLEKFNPLAPRLIRMRTKARAPCRVADLQRVVLRSQHKMASCRPPGESGISADPTNPWDGIRAEIEKRPA
jgi:hypothetical protein